MKETPVRSCLDCHFLRIKAGTEGKSGYCRFNQLPKRGVHKLTEGKPIWETARECSLYHFDR